MAKEPIPTKDYIIPVGRYFLSAGKTLIYQVVSGACCRIYWQKYDDKQLSNSAKEYMHWIISPDLELVAITPWKTESAWYPYKDKNGDEQWRRDGANFPSYDVKVIDFNDKGEIINDTIISITVRWKPIQSSELQPLIELKKMAQSTYQNQPVRPELLTDKYQDKIRRIAA